MAMSLGSSSSRRRRGGSRRTPMAEINVTPFVDVMLVLLIIFMITAPLLTAGVQVDLPQTRAASLPGQDEPLGPDLDDVPVHLHAAGVAAAAGVRDQRHLGVDAAALVVPRLVVER